MKKKTIIALVVVCIFIVLFVVSRLHVYFGYFPDDKAASEIAETALVRRYNAKQFNDIYLNAADAFKSGQTEEVAVAAMNASFKMYGEIATDTEAATTCFPRQVRMVRWLSTIAGKDLTEMSMWYVPDGKAAKLLSFRVSPGRAAFDPASAKTHSCDH